MGDIALAGSGDHEFFPGFRFSLQDESAVFFRKSRAEQAGGCARIETGGAAADDNKPIYGRSIVFFIFLPRRVYSIYHITAIIKQKGQRKFL